MPESTLSAMVTSEVVQILGGYKEVQSDFDFFFSFFFFRRRVLPYDFL